MRKAAAAVVASCLFVVVSVSGQGVPALAPLPEIPGVTAKGTHLELVKEGFKSSEGPIVASDGSLLFGEHATSRIIKIDSAGNASTFLETSNNSSGLAYDSKGRLVSVQRGGPEGKPQLGVLLPTRASLVTESPQGPIEFPNDIVVNRQDGFYFTDSGRNPAPGETNPVRKGAATYYFGPDSRLIKLSDEVLPNGIQLSPDEKVLYINNLNDENIVAYDVQPDGSVRNRRTFGRLQTARAPEGSPIASRGMTQGFRPVGADGMAVDAAGRLYVTTTMGVQVLDPKGQHLGTLQTPRPTQNVAFAGVDRKTLYVLSSGTIWMVPTLTSGVMHRAK